MSESPQGPANPQARKRSPLVIVAVLAAVVVLGCAAWYAWGYFAAKGAVDAVKQATGQSDAGGGLSNTSKPSIDINVATPDQFYSDANFTDEQRVDWAWNKINQPSHLPGNEGMTLLQVGYKEVISRNNLTPEKSGGLYKPFFDQVQPSESMTGDQILALGAAIDKVAVSSELSGSDREKVLAAEVASELPSLTRLRLAASTQDTHSLGGTSQVIVDATTGNKVESPVFRQYQPENGYKPNGTPSKIMTTIENSTGKFYQDIVRFVNGKPLLVDSYSGDNTSKLVPDPEKIPQNS